MFSPRPVALDKALFSQRLSVAFRIIIQRLYIGQIYIHGPLHYNHNYTCLETYYPFLSRNSLVSADTGDRLQLVFSYKYGPTSDLAPIYNIETELNESYEQILFNPDLHIFWGSFQYSHILLLA